MVALVRRHPILILVAVLTLAADQASKLGIVRYLRLGESWPDEGFFRLTHIANSGSAFGLIGDQNAVLTTASIVGIAVMVLFYRSRSEPGVLLQLSIGLMFAGAVGNLVDRILLGHVTDFIDVGPWYIFNIADASIVTGVTILAATMLLFEQPQSSQVLLTVSYPGDEEYRD